MLVTRLMDNRVGRFRISMPVFFADLEMVREVMRRVIVVRAEMMYVTDSIDYVAVSEEFDEAPEYSEAPWYEVGVDYGKVTFRRKTPGPSHTLGGGC